MEEHFLFEVEDNDTDNISEYDITTSPRDLTPASIVDMIESGIMEIPLFQRNYIWDIGKASKLIESIILGLPIPELFFYAEGDENSTYKIIDGQQRLLSIYFFLKGRFPKKAEARIQIGKQINEGKNLATIMADNTLFSDFALMLNKNTDEYKSKYDGLKYIQLDRETQLKFRLRRYLRTVVIRQNKPENDYSSMFEIFNRLNTGGAALTHQEVRASLYYCNFYKMLTEINNNMGWRELLNKPTFDLHSNDIELILRAFALLIDGENYKPKMASFLNKFSAKSKSFGEDYIEYLKHLFESFIESCSNLTSGAFFRNSRFSKALFESVFIAVCQSEYASRTLITKKINEDSLSKLKNDSKFIESLQSGVVSSEGVKFRKEQALKLIELDEES